MSKGNGGMRTSLAIFLVAIVLSEPAFADYVQLVARAKPAVVQIDVDTDEGSQSGTGFFISSDGYLVTNAHVLARANCFFTRFTSNVNPLAPYSVNHYPI